MKRKYHIERNTNHKNTIKVERARKKISQEQLAEILDISRQSILQIESNKTKPSITLALKMAKYFKCIVEDLFQITKW